MRLLTAFIATGLLMFGAPSGAAAMSVIQVDAASLSNITDLRTFGDGTDFGVTSLAYGERFLGQTTTLGGPLSRSEILSGTPTDPLQLESRPNEGVCFFAGSIAGKIANEDGTQRSCGEGSIAFLFEEDQTEIAIVFGGLNSTEPIIIDFFGRDGSLLEQFTLLPDASDIGNLFSVGFQSVGELAFIAGLSISNQDFAGLVVDQLAFGAFTQISEPSTIVLFAFGLLVFGFIGWRRSQIGDITSHPS